MEKSENNQIIIYRKILNKIFLHFLLRFFAFKLYLCRQILSNQRDTK